MYDEVRDLPEIGLLLSLSGGRKDPELRQLEVFGPFISCEDTAGVP